MSGSLRFSRVKQIAGPLLIVETNGMLGYEELVEVEMDNGERRLGRALEVTDTMAVMEIFEGTEGISVNNSRVKFLGKPLEFAVSNELLGRIFDGLGRPMDGMPPILGKATKNINGDIINPYVRDYPDQFIQTGISVIDGMLSLVRGQKLPIFSGAGLPHDVLAAQIAKQSTLSTGEDFAVVFAAVGVANSVAMYYRRQLQISGQLKRSVLFLNLAEDPAIERIVTPRIALTAAEHLAFEEGYHVLVILVDMTNYAEALREISIAREEVPSRRGYPGYLYTDLATMFERCGKIKGKKGSLTQLPILSMPGDDITHPVPDLTGYITEGQIVLSRDLQRKGIYPPVDVLPSLSRLMNQGIGKGRTRDDHRGVADQIYSAYANGKDLRSLSAIVGEEALGANDRKYLKFADLFEGKYVNQGFYEDRSIETTLNLGWDLLSTLPESDMKRVKSEQIAKYGKWKKE